MSYASDLKKKLFLKALKANLGNISQTCKDVEISRSTYHYWLDMDSVFETQINDLQDSMLDKAEAVVHNAIDKENLKAAMFLLTTKGKHRGYTTKQTIEAIQKKDVVFSFEPVEDKKQLPPGNDNQIIDIDHEDITE